jgi:biotin carboxyl carrier protein
MPCKILQVLVKDGDDVKKGMPLLVTESMKTELRIMARSDGVIKLHVKEGDVTSEGATLLEVKAVEE